MEKPEEKKPTDFSKPDSPSVKIYLSQHMRKKRKKAEEV